MSVREWNKKRVAKLAKKTRGYPGIINRSYDFNPIIWVIIKIYVESSGEKVSYLYFSRVSHANLKGM